MRHRLLIAFPQIPYISVFLNKLKCDDIPCQIELSSPVVGDVILSYNVSTPEEKDLKDTIIRIAYSCGAGSIKELSYARSSNKRNSRNSG